MRIVTINRTAIMTLLFLLAGIFGSNSLLAASRQVLILHDSSGDFGHIGKENAIMLENLLGHFDADITVAPVSSYTSGLIENNDATFYIGSTFDEESYLGEGSAEQQNYRNFIKDAATTGKPITWIQHN